MQSFQTNHITNKNVWGTNFKTKIKMLIKTNKADVVSEKFTKGYAYASSGKHLTQFYSLFQLFLKCRKVSRYLFSAIFNLFSSFTILLTILTNKN